MFVPVQFPMKKLVRIFEEQYELLYNNQFSSPKYKKEIDAFDLFFNSNREFVHGFNRERGELLTSDREIVAFMLALKNCTIL